MQGIHKVWMMHLGKHSVHMRLQALIQLLVANGLDNEDLVEIFREVLVSGLYPNVSLLDAVVFAPRWHSNKISWQGLFGILSILLQNAERIDHAPGLAQSPQETWFIVEEVFQGGVLLQHIHEFGVLVLWATAQDSYQL